jgi:hypothetical protein
MHTLNELGVINLGNFFLHFPLDGNGGKIEVGNKINDLLQFIQSFKACKVK